MKLVHVGKAWTPKHKAKGALPTRDCTKMTSPQNDCPIFWPAVKFGPVVIDLARVIVHK